jgi:purine-binding chemotaxis protein CheW
MNPEQNLSAQQKQKILEERARLLARLPEQKIDSRESLELITFHLGNDYVGIPTSMVNETQPLRTLKWSRVPTTPPFIIGAVNLRGHIYSIMDLAQFAGLAGRPLSQNAHILLVRGGIWPDGIEMELTILSDDIPQVRTVLISELTPPPTSISRQMQGYIRGITPDMLMVLDMQQLLSDQRLIIDGTD